MWKNDEDAGCSYTHSGWLPWRVERELAEYVNGARTCAANVCEAEKLISSEMQTNLKLKSSA